MLEELPVVAGVVDWAAAIVAAPSAAVPTRTAKKVRFMVLFLTDAASTGFASWRLASIVGLATHHPGWKGIAWSIQTKIRDRNSDVEGMRGEGRRGLGAGSVIKKQ